MTRAQRRGRGMPRPEVARRIADTEHRRKTRTERELQRLAHMTPEQAEAWVRQHTHDVP